MHTPIITVVAWQQTTDETLHSFDKHFESLPEAVDYTTYLLAKCETYFEDVQLDKGVNLIEKQNAEYRIEIRVMRHRFMTISYRFADWLAERMYKGAVQAIEVAKGEVLGIEISD